MPLSGPVKNWCCLEAPRKVEKLPSAQKLLDAKAQRLAQQKAHGMQSNMSTSSTRETCSPFSSPADTTNHQASAQAAVHTADSGSIEALTHATPQERLEFQFFCDQVGCKDRCLPFLKKLTCIRSSVHLNGTRQACPQRSRAPTRTCTKSGLDSLRCVFSKRPLVPRVDLG